MLIPEIEEKVAFLSKPQAYPLVTARVEVKETHRSWVFLTETQAWKLKKPVRTDFLDFSTLDARQRNCEAEVRLNRRLAADVYHGVVPLRFDADRGMRLGGSGEVIDWLVMMRRLPADRMLDRAIADRSVSDADVQQTGMLLARFYKQAPPITITVEEYRRRLAVEICANRQELLKPDYELPVHLVKAATNAQVTFLHQEAAMLDGRVQAGKVIEVHGDLRPEHICLERPPAIIDCLEFNRDFRILDAASELAFLVLECERLQAPRIGELILETVRNETSDNAPERLMRFYKNFHACLRAKIALWRLKTSPDRAKWIARANSYLQLIGSSSSTMDPPE
jgi:aminoglycoside phosphotransferase family enzyme